MVRTFVVSLLLCFAENGALKLPSYQDPVDQNDAPVFAKVDLEDGSAPIFSKIFGQASNRLAKYVDRDVISSVKVLHTHGKGELGYDLLEVYLQDLSTKEKNLLKLDVDHGDNKPKGGGGGGLPGGFHYTLSKGTFVNGIRRFLEMVLKDLPEEKLERLKKCGGAATSNPMGNEGGAGVWLVLNGEKVGEQKLFQTQGFNKNKVLVLGAGGKDIQSKTGMGRSIWIPGASLAFMQMSQTPMQFENRTFVEEVLKLKQKDHTYAYQHHNCKANRDNAFNDACKGLAEHKLKCWALGKCGKKSMGSPR